MLQLLTLLICVASNAHGASSIQAGTLEWNDSENVRQEIERLIEDKGVDSAAIKRIQDVLKKVGIKELSREFANSKKKLKHGFSTNLLNYLQRTYEKPFYAELPNEGLKYVEDVTNVRVFEDGLFEEADLVALYIKVAVMNLPENLEISDALTLEELNCRQWFPRGGPYVGCETGWTVNVKTGNAVKIGTGRDFFPEYRLIVETYQFSFKLIQGDGFQWTFKQLKGSKIYYFEENDVLKVFYFIFDKRQVSGECWEFGKNGNDPTYSKIELLNTTDWKGHKHLLKQKNSLSHSHIITLEKTSFHESPVAVILS